MEKMTLSKANKLERKINEFKKDFIIVTQSDFIRIRSDDHQGVYVLSINKKSNRSDHKLAVKIQSFVLAYLEDQLTEVEKEFELL